MALQLIQLGTPPAAEDGDTTRTAFEKCNANFEQIFSAGGESMNAKALNSLAGAAGKIPVFTGPGAMALRDIVGAVSQSGGIPTGALFEYGANANGEYFRLSGGLQICAFSAQLTPIALSQEVVVNRTLPAAFASVAYRVSLTPVTAQGGGNQSAIGALAANGIYITKGLSQLALASYAYREAMPNAVDIDVVIWGRWH